MADSSAFCMRVSSRDSSLPSWARSANRPRAAAAVARTSTAGSFSSSPRSGRISARSSHSHRPADRVGAHSGVAVLEADSEHAVEVELQVVLAQLDHAGQGLTFAPGGDRLPRGGEVLQRLRRYAGQLE